MADDQSNSGNNSGKTLSVPGKKTLTLKGGSGSPARDRGGRGPKTVVVEKRRRVYTPGGSQRPTGQVGGQASPPAPKNESPKKQQHSTKKPQSTDHTPQSAQQKGHLTLAEAEARQRALQDAALRQVREQKQAEEEASRRRELDAKRKADREAIERLQLEEEARREEERERKAQEELQKAEAVATVERAESTSEPALATVGQPSQDKPKRLVVSQAELERAKRAAKAPSEPRAKKGGDDRRRTRLTVTGALSGDAEQERSRSVASMRRRREKQKLKPSEPQLKVAREVTIPEAISVQELANRMAERAVDVIKLLMQQGQMAKITDVLDADTAQLVAEELGHTVKRVAESDVEEGLFHTIEDDDAKDLKPRPPVVTIMGHVDHGKTSLLDALREANVVSGEAGGITQHIGAYQVITKDDHAITFLDTPGHEAFTAMRARGANVTDIVVLVVAADDGVMPQTVEAIRHAKSAEVPLILVINKIDKEGAEPDRVRNELLQHEIIVESLGGDVQEVQISALKKTNLEGVLDAIVLQSELMELTANPDARASGTVIEAKLDHGRGSVATVLVQRGALNVGDIVIAGGEWAKVRALINDRGQQIQIADPSTPVEVLGFGGTPSAGDLFAVVDSEARAREITEYRVRKEREKSSIGSGMSLEQMMIRQQTEKAATFVLVIKGDVQGSVEAIVGALDKLGTDEVKAQVLYAGAGGITESDITLAQASQAVIMGFNVRANRQAREAAMRDGVQVRYYNVIYDLIEDVKAAMSGMLSPERRETFIGNAEILEVFNVSKVGKVAGCQITEGMVERGSGVRLIRDDVVIHEGKLSTLKRFKDEVDEVQSGQECGMAFENYQDMRKGDVIECYRVEEVARSL